MRVARRPRDFVGVRGPDAASYLQAMVSNDVEALGVGGCVRGAAPDGEGARDRAARRAPPRRRRLPPAHRGRASASACASTLLRSRFAAKCEIELRGAHLVGRPRREPSGIPTADYGVPAVEVLDEERRADDRRRRARAPAHPRRDASLRPRDRRSRASRRGRARRARRRLREGVLSGPGADRAPALPRSREPDAARARDRRRASCPSTTPSSTLEGKVVGRVTSAAPDGDGVVALGYVRVRGSPRRDAPPRGRAR